MGSNCVIALGPKAREEKRSPPKLKTKWKHTNAFHAGAAAATCDASTLHLNCNIFRVRDGHRNVNWRGRSFPNSGWTSSWSGTDEIIHRFFSRIGGSGVGQCEPAPILWFISNFPVKLDPPAPLFNRVNVGRDLAYGPHGDLAAPDRGSRNFVGQQILLMAMLRQGLPSKKL